MSNSALDLNSLKVAVVIPTRNRPSDLADLLTTVAGQSLTPARVIIVDSSDETSEILSSVTNKYVYIKTNIRSAAQQRNIGLDWLWLNFRNCEFVAFLDDDVLLPTDYLERLVKLLASKQELCGVSGIAGFNTIYRKGNFILDSIGITGREGSVTKACINIPVKPNQGIVTDVDWLIGCSVWRYFDISNLFFERDFFGSSIFEDVIFSFSVRKIRKKKLAVISDLIFEHKLSNQSREGNRITYSNWINNRQRFQLLNNSEFTKFQMNLCNVLLIGIYSAIGIFGNRTRLSAATGIAMGLFKSLRS